MLVVKKKDGSVKWWIDNFDYDSIIVKNLFLLCIKEIILKEIINIIFLVKDMGYGYWVEI